MEKNIYEKLLAAIGNEYGVCGLMGNIQKESGMCSINMQNSYESKLGMNDAQYTSAVDSGAYADFCTDRVGYGLCQWTSAGRKTGLLNYARATGRSVGNEDMQIEWLLHELSTSYKNVLNVLKTAKSVKEASDCVVTKYEKPRSVLPGSSESVRNKTLSERQKLGEEIYNRYCNKGEVAKMEIKQILLTKNDCYKAGRTIVPVGIVVHSTGANNPALKRYVQPDDGIVGKNSYNNHWNKSGVNKCVHAFIGKDKNGNVCTYQTLPWTMRSWGCGSGKKGSYNNSHIQFEICEDGLSDPEYFNKVFDAAAELCASLCQAYGISAANIVSHNEAYKKGYASGHSDCDHWLKRFSKNMDWFRNLVAGKIGTAEAPKPTEPSQQPSQASYKVRITASVLNVRAGAGTSYKINTTVKKGQVYTIVEEKNGWCRLKSGAGWILLKYTEKL